MLQGIALFLLVGTSMLLAAVAIGLSAVVLVILSQFELVRRRQASPRSDFLETLQRRLGTKALLDVADLHRAYRAFFGVGVLRASHLEDIAEFLGRAAQRIESARAEPRGAKRHATLELVRELTAANRRALEVERMCAPFSGTPEPERRMLQEILDLPGDGTAALRSTLDGLAKAVRFRHDTLEWLDEGSRRAVRLARWGWYTTLLLGLLSLLLGVLCLGL